MANATRADLSAARYVETEYFISGDARRYAATSEHGDDGRWAVTADGTAPFTTRIIVRRPLDSATFSGTVLVEWLNVSAGVDSDPDWGYTSAEILREGHAWVGVSAQAVGAVGGESALGGDTGGLRGTDAARYGALVHPGDAYSFDIFAQAAKALSAFDGPAPLGELTPTAVIAIGESQSATFLTTYINALHPIDPVFDGFLVHSRLGVAPSIDTPALARGAGGVTPIIRTDIDVPTMIFSTETDLTVLGNAASRQDDSDVIRLWEVAGTAHADAHLLSEVYGAEASSGTTSLCTAPLNDGPQHQTLKAALHHLVAWVSDGTLPPTAPRLDVSDATGVAVIQRDQLGNALGGIRTPLVDVPISALSGDPVPGAGGFCFLFGSTTPFDAATLAGLYPSHDDYVDKVSASTQATLDAGYILAPEAEAIITKAEASDIG